MKSAAALAENSSRTPSELRSLRALLCWRMRRLLATLPRREQRALRFLPALLHASFPTPELRPMPPGLEGFSSPRRSWFRMARSFGLPAPIGTQRQRKTIRAIVAIPHGDRLVLQVVPIAGARQPELDQIVARCKIAEGLFQRLGISISLQLAPPLVDETGLRLFLFGGLLAGSLPALDWDGLSIHDTHALARLIQWAPSTISSTSLLFLRPGTSSTAASTFFRAHSRGHAAALLADADLFCAAWVSRNRPEGRLPLEIVRAASPSAQSRRAAAGWLQTPPPSGPIALAALGRRLNVAAARALRRFRLAESLPLRRIYRRDLLTSSGLPRCLQGVFEESLSRRKPMRPAELIALGGGDPSSHLETRLIRGLALLGRHAPRLGSELDPPWPRIARELEHQRHHRSFLLFVDVRELEGPPMDPLNRGPHRENSLHNGLAARIGGERRPTARRLSPITSVVALLRAAARGRQVEVLAESPAAEPAAARLQRLAAQVEALEAPLPPLAVELGGDVLLLGEARELPGPSLEELLFEEDGGSAVRRSGTGRSALRVYGLRPFVSRPRRYLPDPDAPDLGAAAGYAGPAAAGTLDCLVLDQGGPRALVFTTDAAGYRLREELHLERLEAHLREARLLLRAAPSPLALTLRVVGLERRPLAGAPEAPPIPIAVEGELLHGLRLTLVGDHFGRLAPEEVEGGAALGGGFAHRPNTRLKGWEAAATTLLSVWPITSHPVVSFPTFDVTLRGEPLSGLLLLYARSVVMRRLDLHIRRMLGA